MQKAHAQWGGEPGEGSSDASSSKSPTSSASSSRSNSIFVSGGTQSPLSGAPNTPTEALALSLRSFVAPPPTPSWEERGVQFYIDHYLLGFPDEPKTPTELNEKTWLYHPSIRTVMAAVGLAARSNLTGDDEMKSIARHSYVSSLKDMGSMLANPQSLRLDIALRGVVMLAMFEVGVLAVAPRTGKLFKRLTDCRSSRARTRSRAVSTPTSWEPLHSLQAPWPATRLPPTPFEGCCSCAIPWYPPSPSLAAICGLRGEFPY